MCGELRKNSLLIFADFGAYYWVGPKSLHILDLGLLIIHKKKFQIHILSKASPATAI